MICPTCQDAAARRAPADQHCIDPTCPCGHRTDRYRAAPCACGGTTTQHDTRCPVRPERLAAVAAAATALLPAEARAAGLHFEYATDPAVAQSVKRLTTWVPACDSGRHYDHPGETCEEYEAYCEAAREAWENTFGAVLAAHLTPMSDVPTALRGTSYPQAEDDTAPPREVATVTRALGPAFWEAVRRDPRADIPPYDPITGYRTWAELEAAPPQFTGILALYEQQAANTAAHAAAVETAIARVEAAHGPDDVISIPRTATTKD